MIFCLSIPKVDIQLPVMKKKTYSGIRGDALTVSVFKYIANDILCMNSTHCASPPNMFFLEVFFRRGFAKEDFSERFFETADS